MSRKVYAHFVADFGSFGCSEFRGIVELRVASDIARDEDALARELARDLNLDAQQIHVLRWSSLH